MGVVGSRRTSAMSVLAVLALTACSSSGAVSSPSSSPTAAASASPSPIPSSSLVIDALPTVPPDPATLTTVCDPEAAQVSLDAGEATIFCVDGVQVGLRAISSVTTAPIERLYFHRPTCVAIPCTPDELGTATVVGWTASEAFSVGLDSRLDTVATPVQGAAAPWPVAGSSAAPAAKRLDLGGAPKEVADRTPYPFCGEAEIGEPASVTVCFRDAVLSGRSAEMIEHVFSTEGDPVTWLFRFGGHGAVTRYMAEKGHWQRQAGSMILGVTSTSWDFDPWDLAAKQF